MKSLLLIALATLCFAGVEAPVSRAALMSVEGSINDKIRSNINDPYELLGTARGTYLQGYGAVFTVEMNLVYVSPLFMSPFKPTVTEDELKTMHERKVKKIDAFRELMRASMLSAGKSLTALPPDERIVMEVFLYTYRWEDARGLPHRIVLSARKQQILDAAERHAPLTSVVQEEVVN